VAAGLDDGLGAVLLGRAPIDAGETAPVGQDDGGADLGAAEVDSDDGLGGQGRTSRSTGCFAGILPKETAAPECRMESKTPAGQSGGGQVRQMRSG